MSAFLRSVRNAVPALLLLAFPAFTLAQDPAPVNPIIDPAADNSGTNPAQLIQASPAPRLAAPKPALRESVSVDGSYVGGSDTKSNGNRTGDLSESVFKFDYRASLPVDDKWAVQFGAGYKRLDFSSTGSVGGTPQNLETASLLLGGSYQLDDKWTLFAIATPELNGVNGDENYLHLGGAVGYVYKYRPNLIFTTGLAVNPGGALDVPVMLIGGVHWKIDEAWTLDLGLPRSAIDYAVTKQLHVWFGPSFEGGLYRTSSSYGDALGRPDLDGRKVVYREIRVGVGADYAFCPSMSLGAQVGSAVYREFEFKDDNTKVHADPAPFGQIGVKVGF